MNYFDISDSDSKYCVVESINREKTLILRVFNLGTRRSEWIWIEFYGVLYFDGFTHWQGANFSLGYQHELVLLLRSLRDETILNQTDVNLEQEFKLFVVNISKLTNTTVAIRILAKDGKVVGRNIE